MPTLTPSPEIQSDNYAFLQKQVYSQTGIVLENDKHYLFESRLTPIVRQMGLATINDLCALMRATSQVEVGRRVVEAMTTNETYFFRDPSHYDAIRTELLPRLKRERSDTRRLRVWSAASSTGQEAYSLAMMLLEEGLGDWDVQILGTDFSSQVVDRARAAKFQQIEVNRGLPASLLVKYFKRSHMEWQLADAVRRMVRFDTIDLRKSMRALGPFDVVFCRNVLIYFDGDTKQKILEELHGTLFRGGWLFLGARRPHSEWINGSKGRRLGPRSYIRPGDGGMMTSELCVGVTAEEVGQIVESVFQSMLGMEVQSSHTAWYPSAARLTAAVHLAGEWNGAVLVECDCELACKFAGYFLGSDAPGVVDDVVRDVLGELANMIGGNMKCVLTRGIHLSMPSVVDGSDYSMRVCGGAVRDRLPFVCEYGPFWITVLVTSRS
jgi:chemotaxis protein methyltransferase CheR